MFTYKKDLPLDFSIYSSAVMARASYLYESDVKIETHADSVSISVVSETKKEAASILKDIAYLFYREKIHSETSDIRAALWGK